MEGVTIGCHTIKRPLSYALPNLKTLSIYECKLSDKILNAIAEGLQNAKHIQSVIIDKTRGLSIGQAAILNRIHNHPTLKKLSFYHSRISEFEVPLACRCPKIEVSDALETLFRHNNVLQSLNLDACHVLSEDALIALEKTFRRYNKSIIKMDLRPISPDFTNNNIAFWVHNNYAVWLSLQPKPSKKKPNYVIKLSCEALQHCMNSVVRNLIKSNVTTLSLVDYPRLKYRYEEPRLSIDNDNYICINQLNQWLDVAFTGQFEHIDLSHEYELPAQHQGLILERFKQYYQSNDNVKPLRSLDLSHNNLMGQVDKLVALPEVCEQINQLILMHVKFKPGEITTLVKALTNYPQLKDLAICTEPELSHQNSVMV